MSVNRVSSANYVQLWKLEKDNVGKETFDPMDAFKPLDPVYMDGDNFSLKNFWDAFKNIPPESILF